MNQELVQTPLNFILLKISCHSNQILNLFNRSDGSLNQAPNFKSSSQCRAIVTRHPIKQKARGFRDCLRTQIPPGFSQWNLSFNLESKTPEILRYHGLLVTWRFSFYLTLHRRRRPKLKHQATKVGGIRKITTLPAHRLK